MFRWWHWPHQHKTTAWSGAEGELYFDRCYSRQWWPSSAGKQGTASASAWHRRSQTTVSAGSSKYQQEHIWAMNHDSCGFWNCLYNISFRPWLIPSKFFTIHLLPVILFSMPEVLGALWNAFYRQSSLLVLGLLWHVAGFTKQFIPCIFIFWNVFFPWVDVLRLFLYSYQSCDFFLSIFLYYSVNFNTHVTKKKMYICM